MRRTYDIAVKEEIKREYLMGDITLKQLAEKKKIPFGTIIRWSYQDGGWKRMKKALQKEEAQRAFEESLERLKEKLSEELETSFELLFRLFEETISKAMKVASQIDSTGDLYRLSMTLKNLCEIRSSMIKELRGGSDEKRERTIQFQLPSWITERFSES